MNIDKECERYQHTLIIKVRTQFSQDNDKENPVGMNIRDNMFFAMENKLPHGAKHTDERGTFSKVVILTPFGSSQYWTKQ